MNATELRMAVNKKFAPRFAPDARLIYMRGRRPVVDERALKRLGFLLYARRTWPDVVLHAPRRKRLYLIQVVGACGPISPERRQELETMLSDSVVKRVYVSVFSDLKEYTRRARNIAWDTDAWIAAIPHHMIHHNGVEHLRPRRSSKRQAS